jgi:hypothetical protein
MNISTRIYSMSVIIIALIREGASISYLSNISTRSLVYKLLSKSISTLLLLLYSYIFLPYMDHFCAKNRGLLHDSKVITHTKVTQCTYERERERVYTDVGKAYPGTGVMAR